MSEAFDLPHSLLSLLNDARELLNAMGPEFSGMQARIAELNGRLAEGAFRLAVLGQFKRGKSTLLNALLGELLLPTGVLPLTALPTILRYGPSPCVRVAFVDGRCEEQYGSAEEIAKVLQRYVTEQENPGNRLRVSRVEVEQPAMLLAKGVSIIDTPGIGSTIVHNTRTAQEVLPACDAALFILSPDPPITEVEVEFLKAVKDATARVIFVLTKADLVDTAHRHELLEFLNQVLCNKVGFGDPAPIFVVSATQALAAQRYGDATLRAQSGIETLERYLSDFLVSGKPYVLHQAIRGKAARVLAEAVFALELHRKALDLPRQELERRWNRLQEGLAKIEQDGMYFRDRLAGDRQRLVLNLDDESERLGRTLRDRLVARAHRVREHVLPSIGFASLTALMQSALGQELQRWLPEVTVGLVEIANARLEAVEDVHCRQLGDLIDRVRRTAADLFEVPYLESVSLDVSERLAESPVLSKRCITSFTEHAAFWLTRFLPAPWRRKRFEEWLSDELDYLVARNIEETRWPIMQNLEDALRIFQKRVEEQLECIIASIRNAVQSAVDRQSERQTRYAPEIKRVEKYRRQLDLLLAELAPGGDRSEGRL